MQPGSTGAVSSLVLLVTGASRCERGLFVRFSGEAKAASQMPPAWLEGNAGGARLLLLELRKALPSSRNSAAFRQGPLGPGPAEHVRGSRSAWVSSSACSSAPGASPSSAAFTSVRQLLPRRLYCMALSEVWFCWLPVCARAGQRSIMRFVRCVSPSLAFAGHEICLPMVCQWSVAKANRDAKAEASAGSV